MAKPLSDPVPIDDPQRRRLPVLLRKSWQCLSQAFRRQISYSGVTPDQFLVMRMLAENASEPLTQNQLAELIASDPNTIGALIERMEKAGWVGRSRNEEDRRAYRLRLLPAGLAKFNELRKIAISLQTDIMSAIPESRRDRFLEDLDLIAERSRTAALSSATRPLRKR